MGITEPSESLRQSLNPVDQVANVGPEVHVGYPLQSAEHGKQQALALADSVEGTITRPIGSVEATTAKVGSTKTISSQTIELSDWIHKRSIRVLLDSGSIGNYISNQEAHSLDLIVQKEEGSKQLSLADGSKVQAKGYVSFRLRCSQYNSEVIAGIFPHMH